MALKQKGGAPKAGPKKRRARTEAEAIRNAVDEHGVRQPAKKATKVREYSYKEAQRAKRKRASAFEAEQQRLFGLRVPDGPTPFEEFKETLAPDARVYAQLYWNMQCEHDHGAIVLFPSLEGAEPTHVVCTFCGSMRQWHGTKTETKRQEWIGYCPDGYDMFEWQDLFVRDRSLWQFIHNEVLAEMSEEVADA